MKFLAATCLACVLVAGAWAMDDDVMPAEGRNLNLLQSMMKGVCAKKVDKSICPQVNQLHAQYTSQYKYWPFCKTVGFSDGDCLLVVRLATMACNNQKYGIPSGTCGRWNKWKPSGK